MNIFFCPFSSSEDVLASFHNRPSPHGAGGAKQPAPVTSQHPEIKLQADQPDPGLSKHVKQSPRHITHAWASAGSADGRDCAAPAKPITDKLTVSSLPRALFTNMHSCCFYPLPRLCDQCNTPISQLWLLLYPKRPCAKCDTTQYRVWLRFSSSPLIGSPPSHVSHTFGIQD
jgi:hypothetical protein